MQSYEISGQILPAKLHPSPPSPIVFVRPAEAECVARRSGIYCVRKGQSQPLSDDPIIICIYGNIVSNSTESEQSKRESRSGLTRATTMTFNRSGQDSLWVCAMAARAAARRAIGTRNGEQDT